MVQTIALDPGGTTGAALRGAKGDVVTCTYATPEELYDLLGSVAKGTQVVIERFTTYGRISAYGLYTVRLIGGVEAICHLRHLPLKEHMPQVRYPFQQPAHVTLVNTKQPFVIHEEDALAHLYAFEHHSRAAAEGKVKPRITVAHKPATGRVSNNGHTARTPRSK